jgi:hypothetical protein
MIARNTYRLLRGSRIGAAVIVLAALLSSCVTTRKDTDYYTITDRDTTTQAVRPVAPGSIDDNGVVFPSTRVTDIHRDILQHDSTYDRKYPNFLRAGGLEFAGLITTSTNKGLGVGLFGVYSMFNASSITDRINSLFNPPSSTSDSGSTSLFKGQIIRISPMEYRLRWFDDAPGWSVGWSPAEAFFKDESDQSFGSILANVYLRKRIFLRDRIPYLLFSPFVGVGFIPSEYANLGGELTFGSIGGLSLRAYAGAIAGKPTPSRKITYWPYFGLGVGVLNFINRPEETEREWKDYIHSAINVNTLEFTLMKASVGDASILQDSTLPFNGLQIKLGNVEFPLPLADHHFWAGTSLLNFMMPGFIHQGLGVLPVRFGYRQYIMAEDLMIEPFFEYNYYPSSFFNAGARIKLDTKTTENFGITFGYTSGSPGAFLATSVNTSGAEDLLSWSTAYLGVSIYLGDWNHTPEQVDAMRATEH